MKKNRITILLLFSVVSLSISSQGLINNGARIVISNTSNIYIDGATGNYTNQNGGLITNSTTGGTITLFGNWINNAANVAFSNDGSTVRLSGAAQSIGGSNSTTFFNLSLLGTNTKTLNINTTVGGIATLTGVLSIGARTLDLNSRTLTVTNPAAGGITYGAGMILSETNLAVNPSIIRWNMNTNTGAHVFPFGVAGVQIPFTFNKTTAGASNISVSTRATAASNNLPWAGVSNVAAVSTMESNAGTYYADASIPSVVDRWWDITSTAAVTANLVFSYRGVENTTTSNPTGTLQAQHWNGTSWDAPVGTGVGVLAGVGTVSVTGANTFSPWIISSILIPLPVELSKFDYACEEDKVKFTWTTSNENNNNYFTIEKSFDGLNYFVVKKINSLANGISNSILEYSSEDINPSNAYYRLSQTDFSGSTKTLKIVKVNNCNASNNVINAFTSNNTIVLQIDVRSNQEVETTLINSLGQIISNRNFNVVEGFNQFNFNDLNLANGIYYISVNGKNLNSYTQKLLISE